MSLTNYIVLAIVLFAIGAVTVLTRRTALIALMGVELMLNSVNLMLVTFAPDNGVLRDGCCCCRSSGRVVHCRIDLQDQAHHFR